MLGTEQIQENGQQEQLNVILQHKFKLCTLETILKYNGMPADIKVEQGGIATSSNGVASSSGKSGSRTYTFRKPFSNANYTITCSPHERNNTSDDSHEGIFNLTKTNFSLLQLGYGSIRWRAEGY